MFVHGSVQPPPTHSPLLTIDDWMQALSAHKWPLLQSSFDNSDAIAMSIQWGDLLGCMDGLYMPDKSYELSMAAWIFWDPITGLHCSGICQTSGTAEEVNVPRSEFERLHTLLVSLKMIQD